MKTTDQRAEQVAADAQRLAEIVGTRLARRARFPSDSTWTAPRRVAAAPSAEPSASPSALPDQFLADFVRRFF